MLCSCTQSIQRQSIAEAHALRYLEKSIRSNHDKITAKIGWANYQVIKTKKNPSGWLVTVKVMGPKMPEYHSIQVNHNRTIKHLRSRYIFPKRHY